MRCDAVMIGVLSWLMSGSKSFAAVAKVAEPATKAVEEVLWRTKSLLWPVQGGNDPCRLAVVESYSIWAPSLIAQFHGNIGGLLRV